MTVVIIVIRTRNIIIGNLQADIDEELFLAAVAFVTFVKRFAFEFVFEFLFLFPFAENDIKLFAIGATEFAVVVAIEFRAFGTVSVAKSETEFSAETVAFETEFRALGILLVVKFANEFMAEFAALVALFVAFVRLDTVFIAELSNGMC